MNGSRMRPRSCQNAGLEKHIAIASQFAPCTAELVLAVLCLCAFAVNVDTTIVNVALRR